MPNYQYITSNTTMYDTIQHGIIWYNTIWYNTTLYDTIHFLAIFNKYEKWAGQTMLWAYLT